MDDLAKWLSEQLDEDARVASTATPPGSGHWSLYIEGGDDGWAFEDSKGGEPGCIIGSKTAAQHITRWDPARVLAEVEAKRAILAGHPPIECSNVRCPVGLHCGTCEYDDPSGNHWPCPTARALALPYRDRPGYRPEWAPEPGG